MGCIFSGALAIYRQIGHQYLQIEKSAIMKKVFNFTSINQTIASNFDGTPWTNKKKWDAYFCKYFWDLIS